MIELTYFAQGDTSELPLHPLTARITTSISSTPERASPESLDMIQCSVFPRLKRPGRESFGSEEFAVVRFSKMDGVVSFDAEAGRSWLHGTEVEAYECS